MIKKISDILRKINSKKIIKIRAKKILNNKYSLYLDIWYNNKRQYRFLKLYLVGKKNEDNEKLRLAIAIRDRQELDILQSDNGIQLRNHKIEANFIEYFYNISLNSPLRYWFKAYKHLKNFSGENLTFKEINSKFGKKYITYLENNNAINENTANLYFRLLKTALNRAIKENILKENPAKHYNIKKKEVKREFLTLEEIKILQNTPFKTNNHLKQAFLFSCFTGLRYSDIIKLKFDMAKEGYLNFIQQKTDEFIKIKLSETAQSIINEQRDILKSDFIFPLPLQSGVSNYMRRWLKQTSISKIITFHCARHTFATLCLTYDVDIFTVSKLLGHKDLKTTQIYAKLIDKKKDEAIDKLPKL